MTALERPLLFDVTRLVSRSWSARRSTGIDRVSYAYLDRFKSRAQAVLQLHGCARVLGADQSDQLFDMLLGPDAKFRRGLLRFAPAAFARSSSRVNGDGAVYINTSHTDFDLPRHKGWAVSCGLRPVYFVHDLIPITHSSLCRPQAVKRHLGRVKGALQGAAGIIVNSYSTARDLHAFAQKNDLSLPALLPAPLAGADLPQENTTPVGDGVDASLFWGAGGNRPYFVCVGTIEPRKNHLLLLKVWQRLVERMGDAAPGLVIIGQWGRRSGPVRKALQANAQLRPYVELVTNCPDRDLGRWMSGAQALLLPSLAEGFGLPLVEALKLGLPVISSDIPSFREMGQGIPLLLDPFDVGAWEAAVSDYCEHSQEQDRQLGMIPDFRPFTWDAHFSRVETWLAALANVPRPAFYGTEVLCLSA